MSTSQVKPIPDGMHAVTPHLVCAGAADAIAFYVKAFQAVELARLPGPDGRLMHAMIAIGGSPIMLADSFPEYGSQDPKALNGTPVTLHLYVEDADKTFAQALAAGATEKMALQDMFWGDRYGIVTDPFGHAWSIATHKQDLTPEQITRAAKEAFASGETGCSAQ